MAERLVLVVDDDADILQTLLFVLRPVCEVRATSSGPEALRIVRRERPSLMLLDVSMPEMGGIGLLRAALELDPRLPVVMLSAQKDLRVVKRALDSGARAYVTKPFEPEALRAEVERVLKDLAAAPADPYRPWTLAA